jgi:predicted metalloprotease with PDZ domain
MASFTDGGRTVDRTNWASSFISYYPFGGAIALALDLSLRGRSDGRVTLDDFMRAMWRAHGKGSTREGYVDRPYTIDDAERRLAEVSDTAFARDFFARYVHGRELPDYARLLGPAGFVLRKADAGRAWWGDVRLEQRDGLRLATAPLANTPLYKAGLDQDDDIRTVDGTRVYSAEDGTTVVRRHRPGDTVSVEFVDRTGTSRTARIVLEEDPRTEIVPIESAGGTPTAPQKAFRQAWLGTT